MTEYYKCYSIPLKRFLDVNMIEWISKGGNPVTNKVFYIYEMTPELSDLLTIWSERSRAIRKERELQWN